MGGHGGLNILPQKRWNVYNFDNREKVKRDEEAAAKEEQLKQEQSRKRDSAYRLEQLRQARGVSSSSIQARGDQKSGKSDSEYRVEQFPQARVVSSSSIQASGEQKLEKSSLLEEKKSDCKHINLFEGIRIFDPVKVEDEKIEKNSNNKRVKKVEPPRVITPEDEKYRLGYGIVGKGTKLPWYVAKRSDDDLGEKSDDDDEYSRPVKKSNVKKTVEELRQERLERERKEKERERALFKEKSRRDGGFSRRR